MTTTPLSCWVISDGRRGIENQALGLAEAAHELRALTVNPHHVGGSAVFQKLPPLLQASMKAAPEDFGLPAAAPDIVIGCGRQAIAPLLAIKAKWPDSFTAYVQDPRIEPSKFDMVIAPEHDALSGANVEQMIGSPNRIARDRIAAETLEYEAELQKLPMPRAAFLIGGTSKTHKLGEADLAAHLGAAKTLSAAGHSLLISTSRRTPDFARQAWAEFTAKTPNVWLHDSGPRNPYFAFLGGADMILVTQDSTNMLTEACAVGKPVFTLPMSGKDGKFAALYAALKTHCGVMPWNGQTSGDDYPALDETARMAERLWAHYDARKAVLN